MMNDNHMTLSCVSSVNLGLFRKELRVKDPGQGPEPDGEGEDESHKGNHRKPTDWLDILALRKENVGEFVS